MDLKMLQPTRPPSFRALKTSIAVVCTLWFSLNGQLSSGDEPTAASPKPDTIATLIEQLGDPQFATREEANRRLLEIGAPALPLLRSAERHALLETRTRASRIRDEIDKVVFENVTKRFIMDGESKQSYGLPAWSQFSLIAGDSRTSKLLFVMMLRNQLELAQLVEAASQAKGKPTAAETSTTLAARMSLEAERLRNRSLRGQLPEVGDTLGLLVACSMFDESVSIEVNEMISASLSRGTHVEYFNKPGYDRCMRALVANWLPKTQATLANEVLSLAMQRSIPQGAVVARRHLDQSTDYETRARALQCLAKFGNETDLENVAKLLNDETVIYEFTALRDQGFPRDGIQVANEPPPGFKQPVISDGIKMVVRMSDLALAVCLLLESKDIKAVFPHYEPNELDGIQFTDIAFAEDDHQQHKQAIAKWKNEHPKFAEKSN